MEELLVLILIIILLILTGFFIFLFFKKYHYHNKTTFRWLRLIIGNGLIFIFFCFLCVLFGEIYFRFIYNCTDNHGLTLITSSWLKKYYKMNNAGFRDSIEYYNDKPFGKRRITFFGDSFTVGYGITDVEKRFSNLIRHQIPNWQVHVLAVNAMNTSDELVLINNLKDWHYYLDQVVLIYNLNDIEDSIPQMREYYTRIYNTSPPGFIFKHSYFFNTLYYRYLIKHLLPITDYCQILNSAYVGKIWEEQELQLNHLIDIVEMLGGRLLVVTFPNLQAMGNNYPFCDIHDKLNAYWKSKNVPHFDLLNLYKDHESEELVISCYDSHPNEYAHKIASKAIMMFFLKNIFVINNNR